MNDEHTKVTEIHVLLARIEEKLDSQGLIWSEKFGGIEARLEKMEKSAVSQGERLGRLEAAEEMRRGERRVLTGVLAVIGGVCGIIGSLIVRLVGGGN